ncbi:RHPN2 [Cordylochernes scorpioides]|uniref:RHPN2 n=1 Tax=Cordylochernes scorpioides TaxID=51811 RepID=A0ABY6KS09_9ARAC|nr:RHPN2 [Cordylochernes scorpioides]
MCGRASTSKKMRESVAMELSFFNSTLQHLKEQLADLNSSVQVYQNNVDHPAMPMIPLGLKETKYINFKEPFMVRCRLTPGVCSQRGLQDFILEHYSEDGAGYEAAIEEFSRIRQAIRWPKRDASGVRRLLEYYNLLYYVDHRFFPPHRNMGIYFEWFDSLTGIPVAQKTVAYEKACVLFNAAALYTQLGSSQFMTDIVQLRTTSAGLDSAVDNFLRAAGIFRYIRDNFSHPPSADLATETLSVLTQLMLAQARECLLEKFVLLSADPNDLEEFLDIAQETSEMSERYRQVARAMSRTRLRSHVPAPWVSLVQVKVEHYAALAHRHVAEGLLRHGSGDLPPGARQLLDFIHSSPEFRPLRSAEERLQLGQSSLLSGGQLGQSSLLSGGQRGQSSLLSGGQLGQSSLLSGGQRGQSSLLSGGQRGQSSLLSGGQRGQSSLLSGGQRGQSSLLSGGQWGQSSLLSGGQWGQSSLLSGGQLGQSSLLSGGQRGQSSLLSGGQLGQSSLLSGGQRGQSSLLSGGQLGQSSLLSGGQRGRAHLREATERHQEALRLHRMCRQLRNVSRLQERLQLEVELAEQRYLELELEPAIDDLLESPIVQPSTKFQLTLTAPDFSCYKVKDLFHGLGPIQAFSARRSWTAAKTLVLKRRSTEQSFGIALAGDCPVTVARAEGPAHEAGLKEGDYIVEVGGCDTKWGRSRDVAELIRDAERELRLRVVTPVVQPPRAPSSTSSGSPSLSSASTGSSGSKRLSWNPFSRRRSRSRDKLDYRQNIFLRRSITDLTLQD